MDDILKTLAELDEFVVRTPDEHHAVWVAMKVIRDSQKPRKIITAERDNAFYRDALLLGVFGLWGSLVGQLLFFLGVIG